MFSFPNFGLKSVESEYLPTITVRVSITLIEKHGEIKLLYQYMVETLESWFL